MKDRDRHGRGQLSIQCVGGDAGNRDAGSTEGFQGTGGFLHPGQGAFPFSQKIRRPVRHGGPVEQDHVEVILIGLGIGHIDEPFQKVGGGHGA